MTNKGMLYGKKTYPFLKTTSFFTKNDLSFSPE